MRLALDTAWVPSLLGVTRYTPLPTLRLSGRVGALVAEAQDLNSTALLPN
jgi:hypothetical protein